MNLQARNRLNFLIETGQGILASATRHGGQLRKGFVTGEPYRTAISYGINAQVASQWRTSCLRFLETQFGTEHSYYRSFESRMSKLMYERVNTALGVLIAARDDDDQEELVPQQPESPKTLEEWAGAQHLSLALVFTDIVKSTEIGIKLGDTYWIQDLFQHFFQARGLAASFDCHIVKVIGDSLMVAFKTSSDAVAFGLNFAEDTGVSHIGIRVGINSGEVQIRDNDIYGLNVNLTSRIQHALPREGILASYSVKRDYEKRYGADSDVRFIPAEVDLKSFGKESVFHVRREGYRSSIRSQRTARESLLQAQAVFRPPKVWPS